MTPTARDQVRANDFDEAVLASTGDSLRCADVSTVQVHVGLKCNLQCVHCHVASNPWRKEVMNWATMELVIKAAQRAGARLVDITGGAPEMNPDFRRFVSAVCDLGIEVLVRTNLTILLEPGYEDMPAFFQEHGVKLVASLPCYLEENVDAQRGAGVFKDSIAAIRLLNQRGYGREAGLPLTLVYNPVGPHLPSDQRGLEEDYRAQLRERFAIEFSGLICITNMPIGRYLGDLKKRGALASYRELLRTSFNPATVEGLMCRHQINVDWDGRIYDCDFNLALSMPVDHGAPTHVRDFDPVVHARRRVVTGNHCFGCTAGRGSSCGGALA